MARPFRRYKWLIIGLSIFSLLAVLLAAYIYAELMGWGGWSPNPNSAYGVRARSVSARLRYGMTRHQVGLIYRTDIVEFPSDETEDDAHYIGEPAWKAERDLFIFEPRTHFWNSFDTGWTVRAEFNQQGKLISHTVIMEAVHGP